MYANRSDINHLNYMRKGRQHPRTNDQNHTMAGLDKKIETNRSDTYNYENPIMAPIDEMINTLLKHSKERSSILIEPIEKFNIGIEKEPRIIHLA